MNPQVIGKLELGREGSEGSQLHHWTEIQVSYFSLFCTQIQVSSCLSWFYTLISETCEKLIEKAKVSTFLHLLI